MWLLLSLGMGEASALRGAGQVLLSPFHKAGNRPSEGGDFPHPRGVRGGPQAPGSQDVSTGSPRPRQTPAIT